MPPPSSADAAPVRPASRRASAMPRSAIRQIMSLANARPNVIHLEVGEPDVSTPAHIVDQAFEAARAGWTKYGPNAGLPSLRQLVAKRMTGAWGTSVDPDQVVITTGAIGALYVAVTSIVEAGDEVLIPDPCWPNYESVVYLAGGAPIRFMQPAALGFLPDPAEIERLITPRTKAIMLNTPGNPTGALYPRRLMAAILDIARRYGVYVVSDEIYEDIVFEGEHVSAGSFGASDRVFVVSGASKSYAMTGWRLGWVVCPPALAGIAASLQEPVTSCASTIAQKAGEAALASEQTCVSQFRDMFLRRRDIVVDTFGNTGLLPMAPQGAFYALIDISRTGRGSLDFAKEFLLTCNTAVVPGVAFGPSCDRYVRIAFTTDDQALKEGLLRLRHYIEDASGPG